MTPGSPLARSGTSTLITSPTSMTTAPSRNSNRTAGEFIRQIAANLELDRSPFAAPDLTASYVRVEHSGGDATVMARIGNGGEVLVAPGIAVAFYDGDPSNGGVLLDTVETTERLEPGQFEDVMITLAAASFTGLWVVADDDGTGKGHVSECSENNNIYRTGARLRFAEPSFTTRTKTASTNRLHPSSC